ncbi:hypothetical protein [Sodalis praecaptivus]|uniref:hypothetical protein n=1 Tax=Sodalis TaxID=84565 RepID=UPI00046CDD0D|nr:hypothetical protein [Sodalis praecaptivus]
MTRLLRKRSTLKQLIVDYVRDHDATNRFEIAAALQTDETNISRVMPELLADKKIFRTRDPKKFVHYHISASRAAVFDELNGKCVPDIVEEYCRHSKVYWFDQRQREARARL